jgi:5-methylcytosine-specific restriction endonuclease McrA
LAIERAAAWKKRNPEKVQASTRARYERVKEHHSAVVEAWRLHNPERKRDHRENRRARERRAFVEDVDRALLWHLFDGLCGICLLPVGLDQMQVDIIPLVKGGLHRYSNVQPSHESCNKRKGASMPAERAVA